MSQNDPKMTSSRPLSLTWVLPEPNLAGGIRAVRELAEAMQRRGHESVFVHPPIDHSWPPFYKPRRFARHLRRVLAERGRLKHHLEHTTIPVTISSAVQVSPADVPKADFLIATWWRTREWIEDFPEDRGKRAYFIQHFETHSGAEPERVLATYRLKSVKFAVAHWLRKKIESDFGDPTTQVVPNGFDRSIFHSPSRSKPSRPTVGFMFSSRKWKGVATALAAVKLLKAQIPDLRIVSFGDEELSEEAAAAGVEYHRCPEQKKIADLYRHASLWIVPSLVEGFGLPGIEAAGCATPLVVTRSGGPEDYTREGENGYLVDPEQPQALAQAALKVLQTSDDEWKALSSGSLRVAEEFEWNRSAGILEKFLLSQLDDEKTVAEQARLTG